MKCPNCWCQHIYVTNTWTMSLTYKGKLYQVIKRRRVCRYCKKVIITQEKIVEGQKPPEEDGEEL